MFAFDRSSLPLLPSSTQTPRRFSALVERQRSFSSRTSCGQNLEQILTPALPQETHACRKRTAYRSRNEKRFSSLRSSLYRASSSATTGKRISGVCHLVDLTRRHLVGMEHSWEVPPSARRCNFYVGGQGSAVGGGVGHHIYTDILSSELTYPVIACSDANNWCAPVPPRTCRVWCTVR